MNWKNLILNIGTVKQNTVANISFMVQDLDVKNIVSFAPSCSSCTTIVGFNKDNTELLVKYSVDSISYHLLLIPGYMDVLKTIVVEYLDGTKEVLSFFGRVVR